MGYTPQLIAPFQTGLDTDFEDWLLPADAHTTLENAHIKHGFIEKRSGYDLETYMMHDLGTDLDITGITQADPAVVTVTSTTNITDGQVVSIQNVGGMTEINNQNYLVANKTATTFEVQNLDGTNVDSSAYTAYTSGGDVFVHTGSNRIMGMWEYMKSDGTKELIIFDDVRAGKYDASNGVVTPLDISSPAYADIFSSGETDWVWAVNWQESTARATEGNKLYFTNGKVLNSGVDGIWSYDGTNIVSEATWYTNSGDSNTIIKAAKFIFSMKQRLLLLSTIENDGSTDITYPQRLRWSAVQGTADTDWNDDEPGKGGYVDAPTGDQIVSARTLQNGIIVYFTNSIWLLSYRSDPALPFVWTKINDTRACDSRMGTIDYDRYVISAGKRGISATDGSESRRIDQRIERYIYDNIDQDNLGKIYMHRSYNNKRLWLLYPASDADNSDENDSALIYDEDSQSFSTYKIAMNCLGTGIVGINYALEDFTSQKNLDWAIEDFTEQTLQSYYEQDDETLFGGDITGKVYVMETLGSDNGTAISATLMTASWAPFKEQGIESQMAYVDIYLDTDRETNLTIEFFKDSDTFCYKSQTIDCLPDLDYIADVSNITNASPISFNVGDHGLSTNDVVYVYNVEGMTEVNSQDNGFTVTDVDADNFTGGVDSSAWGTYISGGKLFKRPFYKNKIWKRVYAGGVGSQHRIRITSSGSAQPFRIHGYKPSFKPTGKRTI